MLLRLLVASVLASAQASAEPMRGRVVTDDGMPLPDSASVVLRCRGTERPIPGFFDGEFFEVVGPSGEDGCAIEIAATAYRRATAPAASLPSNPSIPGLVLHRLGKNRGETISVTHLLAPEEAKRRFHSGIRALRRNEPDSIDRALESLGVATELFPGYAQAWFELGRIGLARGDPASAIDALRKAVAADPWFVSPYEPLILLLRATGEAAEAAVRCDGLRVINPALPPDCAGGGDR